MNSTIVFHVPRNQTKSFCTVSAWVHKGLIIPCLVNNSMLVYISINRYNKVFTIIIKHKVYLLIILLVNSHLILESFVLTRLPPKGFVYF